MSCVKLSLSWELVIHSFLDIDILSSIYFYSGNNDPYCPVYIFIVGTVVHSVLY